MSYAQQRKWTKKHPRGTKQPVIMSTGSGFWPSGGFLEHDFWPYLKACRAANEEPIDCESYYRAMMAGNAPIPGQQVSEVPND